MIKCSICKGNIKTGCVCLATARELIPNIENLMDVPCKTCVTLATCLPKFRHVYFSCSCEILEQYLGCVRKETTYKDYNYKNLAKVSKWYTEKTGKRL